MRRLLLALAAGLALASPASAGPAQTPWPMRLGNAQHTSSTTAGGSIGNPRVYWSRQVLGSGDFSGGVGTVRPRYGPSIGPDGTLLVPSFDRLLALNPSDGATLWQTGATGAKISQPAVTDNGLVIYSSQNVVVAVSTNTGAVQWTVDPRGPFTTFNFPGGSPAIGADGFIYLGDQDDERGLGTYPSYIYKIDASTGGVAWRTKVGASSYSGAPAISTDGAQVIYRGNYTGTISLASATGVFISSHYPGGWADSLALSVDDQGFAYFTSENAASGGEYLMKMDLLTNTTIWRTAGAGSDSNTTIFSPIIAPSRVIASNGFSNLQAFDRTTGAASWTYFPTASLQYGGAPTLVNGTSLYFLDDGKLVSLDPATGAVNWTMNYAGNDGYAQWGSGGIAVSSTGALYFTHTQTSGRNAYAVADSGARQVVGMSSSSIVAQNGSVWTSTVVFETRDGASALRGMASLAISQTATTGLAYNASATTYSVVGNLVNGQYSSSETGLLGLSVEANLNSLSHANWSTFSSTLTATLIGVGATASIVTRETRASTFTVTLSTPSIEDDGTGRIVQVTTLTFTVSNSTGGRVSNFPVGLDRTNFTGTCNAVAPESSLTPASNYYLTDSTGQVSVAYRLRYSESGTLLCAPALALPYVAPTVTAYALGLPNLPVVLADARASTFTVSYSSQALQSDVRRTTMTVTVFDPLGSTVPATIVLLKDMVGAAYFLYGFNGILAGPTVTCGGTQLIGYTDSLGRAQFHADGRNCGSHTFDNFASFLASAPVFTPNVAVSTPAVLVESNFLDSYQVSVPTVTSVGVSFRSTVTAVNAYGHQLPGYTESGVTLTPLFDQTAVQGTGTLGTSVMSFAGSGGQVVISSQTYNKIEDIQIKATRGSGSIKTGLSGTLVVRGPSHFIVTIPTGTQAGVPFSMTVRAVDSSSTPVVGYAGTLSLSALNAANQSLAGAGVLGVTNINMPANGVVTIANQTYTKAESIVIRAADTGAGVVGVSTYAAVVGAGTPAQIALLANPQSTIAGVPSVLTATIYDGYSNPVSNSTATFSVATGSGVVSLSLVNGSVVSAVTSTQAVTDAFGQTQAFFSSTNSLSAQANLLRASIGALARDTTVYSTVLVTSAGGAVVNFSNPLLRADIPANTYGFSVRLGIQGKSELAAADLALTTAAFAATANTFVSTTVLKLSAVRDASPTTAAGAGSRLVTVSMPYVVTSGSISVGAYGAQSILVPLSVMRVFKLNQATSVFEQVIDGVTAVNSVTGVVTAEVSNPDGIYALGAPSFTNLTTGSSATVTTALAGGTTAEVVVPTGGFSAPATISVTVPGASAVPALPARPGLTALGVTISVTAGGLQPSAPVTIKIGYTPAQVAGVNPDHLRLARYDATTGWVVLDSSADNETRQVTGTTDHFSLFQIVAQTPGASVADGFVFPNPFRPALGHTKIKLSNLPAGAHVKIFTATGRLLKELDADAAGQVLSWNGTDRDGRALASGVYLAVIEGTGGRRTIKFAVQR
ncbi:MAG: PQQ-binding-like beta-propeller repeat protein [Elusimicrobia bacterium]|nr:PQQ-binding-like beta-propeller repeat protein [Elusimicrobiota bacterium]